MRIILGWMVFLLTLNCFALDGRKDHRRNMQDLMYQPIKGTFFMKVDFDGKDGGYDTQDSGGTVTSEADTSSFGGVHSLPEMIASN